MSGRRRAFMQYLKDPLGLYLIVIFVLSIIGLIYVYLITPTLSVGSIFSGIGVIITILGLILSNFRSELRYQRERTQIIESEVLRYVELAQEEAEDNLDRLRTNMGWDQELNDDHDWRRADSPNLNSDLIVENFDSDHVYYLRNNHPDLFDILSQEGTKRSKLRSSFADAENSLEPVAEDWYFTRTADLDVDTTMGVLVPELIAKLVVHRHTPNTDDLMNTLNLPEQVISEIQININQTIENEEGIFQQGMRPPEKYMRYEETRSDVISFYDDLDSKLEQVRNSLRKQGIRY